MTPAVIHTQGICKSFGDHRALKPLDMEGQGRIVGLLGPNGAGKTTLLRMLTGITRPDEGELTLWGEKHHRGLLSRMGYLPEERGLYKGMRVAEQVLYFASLRGMKRTDAERELKGWFERLEVEGWCHRRHDCGHHAMLGYPQQRQPPHDLLPPPKRASSRRPRALSAQAPPPSTWSPPPRPNRAVSLVPSPILLRRGQACGGHRWRAGGGHQ